MKRISILTLACLLMIGVSSCGYRVGSLMHPDIKTIGIGRVINETAAYNLSVQMQQLLSEQFMNDGSLKVTSIRNSDVIIYTKILSTDFEETVGRSLDETVYTPLEWKVTVLVEFSVIVPGEKRPLIALNRVQGSTIMQFTGDSETARQRALFMACRDAAEKMVIRTTEAW